MNAEEPLGFQDKLAAFVSAAASHPDPWFSAFARAVLETDEPDSAVDTELVTRLEQQAATGDYEAPAVRTRDLQVPGPHGSVPVRVYQPSVDVTQPRLLVWCHGGAFVSGDLDMPEADATAREIAFRAGAVVVSVDYRRATHGVHFPEPHDDVLAAYEWAVAEYGDGVLGGASAGANLAAGVALRLRDQARPPVGVVLLYPLLHPELPAPSAELAALLVRLPASHAFRGRSFARMVENYLGATAAEATPYAMAALGDLVGFPPTLVINCEYDGLRASGEVFVSGLEAAGVPVTQLLARDVLHGHLNSPWLPQAQQSHADMARWLTSC